MGQIGAIKVNKENYLNFPVAFVIAKYPGAKNVVVLYTVYSLMVWTTVAALYYMLSSSQIVLLLYRSYFTNRSFIGTSHLFYVSSVFMLVH